MRTAMRISGFLAVVATACAWPLLTTIFGAPEPAAGNALLLAGILLVAFACAGRFDREPAPALYLLAAPLLGTAAIFIPWPWSAGLVVLAAGIALVVVTRNVPLLKSGYAAIVAFGAVLAIEALVLRPAHLAMGWFDSAWGLAQPVAWLLRFLGVDASALGSTVNVVTIRDTYRFPAGLELLGFPTALVALAGALALVHCLVTPGRRLRAALILLAAWVVYLPIRAALTLLLFTHLQLYVEFEADVVRSDVVYGPWWHLVTFLPLAFAWGFLAKFEAADARPVPALSPRPARPALVALAAATLGAFMLVFAWAWFEPGEPTEKRLVIDERHSGWESTLRAPGTQWFGMLSMYNMFSLADYYSYYYPLTRNEGPIDDALLRGAGVLILKVPTTPYSDNELAAIERFVRSGGGVYCIGEHTNYVGSAVAINQVLDRLGAKARLRADCVFDLHHPGPYEELWERPSLYYHPILANVPQFRFEVSTSVQPRCLSVDSAIAPGGYWRLNADYHMENYYPFPRKDSTMREGAFTQLAAYSYGKGRVAVFTDSTPTSNFSAFYPGRPELFLGTVDWLGRTPRPTPWRWPLAGIGLAMLGWGLFVLLVKGDGMGGLGLALAAALFGTVAALLASRTGIERNFPLPKPLKERPPVVAFLQPIASDPGAKCDYELPILGFTQHPEKSYDIFCHSALRVRYFPQVRKTIEDAAEDPLLVIPNPARVFTKDDVAKIEARRQSGRSTLVLLSAACTDNDAAAYRSLLTPFGISFKRDASLLFAMMTDAGGKLTGVASPTLVLHGGRPIRLADGKPVGVEITSGPGRFVVLGYGDCFRDLQMGGSDAIQVDPKLAPQFKEAFANLGYRDVVLPDPQMAARFKEEFVLLQRLMLPERNLPPSKLDEVLKDTAWLRPAPLR